MPKKKMVVIFLYAFLLSVLAGVLLNYFFRFIGPKEFFTLKEIETYALSLPEFPSPDNDDWNNPDFSTFFKQRSSPFSESILHKLGLHSEDPWSARFMARLIKKLTEKNRTNKLGDGKNTIIHLRAQEKTKVLVFGDLHGAFHSLLRDLRYLQQRGSLHEDLRILDDALYIVFNGNLIDRSAYSIDTLILVSLLIEKNPRQVIYLAGEHERDIVWRNFSLANELRLRGKLHSDQDIPFAIEINNYFDTLPAALYLSGATDTNEAIRIAFAGKDDLSYQEKNIDALSFNQNSNYSIIQVPKEETDAASFIDVRVAIKAGNWRSGNRIKDGIAMLEQDHGATSWGVLSSPTITNRKFLNFFHDAFSAITLDQKVEDSLISNIHQDRYLATGFVEEEAVNSISGTKNKKTMSIQVASNMSLIRGIPTTGHQLRAGLATAINIYNRDGKNSERGIRLYVANDDYVPRLTRKNTQEQLDLGVRFFLLSLGTPTLAATLDLIKQKEAAVFFPQTGSSLIRAPQFSNIVHYLSSYEDEARALVREMKQEYGARKFAFFYQDDAFGQGPYLAAVEELKKLGITDVIPLPYTRGIMSFSSMTKDIINGGPDAIGFFSVGTATKEFVRQVGVSTLQSLSLFGLSSIGEIPLRRLFRQKGLQVLYGSAVPNPFISTLPIAVEYREAMKNDNNIIDVFSFEAYIATKLFLDALDKVPPGSVTPYQVIKVIEGMKDTNFHGLNYSFNPKTRSLATEVYVESTEKNEWKSYPIEN